MGLGSQSTEDFSGGMYRGRRAPANAVYDLVNGLINDEGQPFRRAGSQFLNPAEAGVDLTTLADMYLAPGRRLVAWGAYPDTELYVLDEDTDAFVSLTSARPETGSRAVQLGAIGVFQKANGLSVGTDLLLYAGSMKTATYSAGTVAVPNAGLTLTGTGTAWLANVDVGMLFQPVSGGALGVVASVDSDTSITLREPWPGTTITGVGYSLAQYLVVGPPASAAKLPATRTYAASVGSPARLVYCIGNRAYFSDRGAATIKTDQYHELPASEIIIGADSIADTLLLFTTGGVWTVTNMALDPVDAYGNIQHQVAEINRDLILWGDAGITGWKGAFIVPAVDDVLIFSADGSSQTITGGRNSQYDGGIRNLYRTYVENGYQPGVATVHQGHLFLPITILGNTVDVLVCRLDHGFAWTHWNGHAACGAYTVRVGAETREPQLLGAGGMLGFAGEQVLDLTACMDNGPSTDADGSTVSFSLTTRDYSTGQQPGFFTKARARYELESVSYFEDTPDGVLGGQWRTWTGTMPTITSHVALNAGAYRDATYSAAATSPDCTTETLFSGAPNPAVDYNFGVGARLTAHSGSANGYMFEIQATDGTGWAPTLYKGAAFTAIATGTTVVSAAVTGMRIVATGTLIRGYLKISGTWTLVVSATDATYTAAGYPGFWIQNFGGSATVGVSHVSFSPSPPLASPSFTSDQDGGDFTDLTDNGEQGGGEGWGSSDGSLYQWATVGKRRERGRVLISVSGYTSRFVLRSIEILSRPSGKQ